MSRPLWLRLARVLLIPVILGATGYGAQALGMLAFDQFLNYAGLPLGTLTPGGSGKALCERVVVVVVDGLREDTSHQMPALEALRASGADLPSWTQVPSLSLPGYTVLATGAYPDLSGVTTNWYEGTVRVDSLFARAREAGMRTALVSEPSWHMLYGPWIDVDYAGQLLAHGDEPPESAWSTEALGQEGLRVLAEEDASLVYIYFGETDKAGEEYGGTSPEYLQAARNVDAQIGAIARQLDWSRDTLIVTADHGMIARAGRARGGGHGGGEPAARRIPLVMAGCGIVPGVYPEGGQADLVPTVATLLGLPIPVHSQGHTRLEALAMTPGQRAGAALALGEQQEALYTAYLRAMGVSPEVDGLEEAHAAFAAGDYERVVGLVEAFLGRLEEAAARAVANRLWRERLVRLPYLLLPPLAGALFIAFYRPRRELARPFLLAGLFVLVHQIVYWVVRGHSFSFSAIGNMDTEVFFLTRTLDGALVMAFVALLAGVLWRRKPWDEVVWGANLSALAIVWLFLLQIGLYLWLYGPTVSWRLPHLGWGFKYYLDLLGLTGVGLAAALVFPWLALGVSRLFLLADRLRTGAKKSAR